MLIRQRSWIDSDSYRAMALLQSVGMDFASGTPSENRNQNQHHHNRDKHISATMKRGQIGENAERQTEEEQMER